MKHSDQTIVTPNGNIFARRWARDDAPPSPPIILLHDSLGCIELWRSFPARLASETNRPVIAYDRLGYGRSDPHPGPQPLSFISDEAIGAFSAVRRHFGISDFSVFGHSVGGAMAIHAAIQFADSCRSVITQSAQAFMEDRTKAGILDAQQGFQDPAHFSRLQKYHGDKADWALNAWVNNWLSPQFAVWNLDDVLPALTCPLLVLHGTQDEYGSVEQPRRLGALAAGEAQVRLLQDCGHVPHREREAEVATLVAEFLGRY